MAQRPKQDSPSSPSVALVLLVAFAVVQAPTSGRAQAPDFFARSGLFADPSGRVAELDRDIASNLSRVEQLEAQRARADAEVAALTTRRAETNRRLRDRARALYRLTHAGALPLSGGFPALLAHLGRRARLERIVLADLEAMEDLRARAVALREESGLRAAELEQARATLRTLEAEKERLSQGGFAGLFATGTPGAVVASGPTYGLSRSPVVSDDGYGIRVVGGDPAPSVGFESQRGQSMIPLLAPSAMRKASREEGTKLEISGSVGATVRAAADGRVAFAHTHAAYGRLVIVDHGASYFTIYGGLGRVDVAIGQAVARGGSLGSLDASPLFFQVRRGTRALDARAWLGL